MRGGRNCGTDLTHESSSILLPSLWVREAAGSRFPASNLLEPHVDVDLDFEEQCCHQNGFIDVLDLTGPKSPLQRVYGRVSPL